MQASKLRSPARDHYWGQKSSVSGAGNLAFLGRSASTHSYNTSKYDSRGVERPDDDSKGKKKTKGKNKTMLTRGASFRRQGSSGMTWADNWIFTDDGMFLGRHAKVTDEKNANHVIHSAAADPSKSPGGSSSYHAQLQRTHSTGSLHANSQRNTYEKPRSHHRSGLWGLRWLKKNFRKAFR